MALRTPIATGVSDLPPAIVLGIDTPIGLTVVRELGERGVPVHGIGCATGSIGEASRYCKSFSRRQANADIAAWLPELIRKTGAKALFAISEHDLVALSQLEADIEGCRILTPRAKPLAIVLHKPDTLAIADGLGIDVPGSWQPVVGQDFAARAAVLVYPVVAKWADPPRVAEPLDALGLPLEKAEFVADAGALVRLLERYAKLGEWPLVQAFCPGVGLGQMIYMESGVATLRFQHRRLHEWPPEGGVSTLCRAESLDLHQAQMSRSEALLKAIGWEGPAMVEYRYDTATGRYWLMEINGRFWGSLPLAWHAGAHFAWEGYRRVVRGDRSPAATPRDGVKARYMIPETRRLGRILWGRRAIADPSFRPRPARDLLRYITDFFNPRMHYFVFSWRDPGPFFADVKGVVRKLLRRDRP
jgi:predicted ATP-grasp superfamily ATP-dependent carboligase